MKHYITDPPCAFIEAVVGGYSPIDKWTCHFARVAEKMRKSAGWFFMSPFEHAACQIRGERNRRWITPTERVAYVADEMSGEIPWRTLHVETSATSG